MLKSLIAIDCMVAEVVVAGVAGVAVAAVAIAVPLLGSFALLTTLKY